MRPCRGDVIVVLVRGDTEIVSWPLAGSSRPDLGVADELAHLALVAGPMGCALHLRNVSAELSDLHLVGLGEVLTW